MTVDQAVVELPIYLGPTLPRWQPRTVADVQAAIDDRINDANKSVPDSESISPHFGFAMSHYEPRPRGAGFHPASDRWPGIDRDAWHRIRPAS